MPDHLDGAMGRFDARIRAEGERLSGCGHYVNHPPALLITQNPWIGP